MNTNSSLKYNHDNLFSKNMRIDKYTDIAAHLKLLLCDSLIRPISIGLIFLCENEMIFLLNICGKISNP